MPSVRLFAAAAALALPAGATAAVDPLVTVSGPSPFIRGCGDAPARDRAFANAEVEPSLATNPANPNNAIAAWQQDRRPDGGARGILVAFTRDAGRTWTTSAPPMFSKCAGGVPPNGADYRSASDPWVSFGPDGRAYLMALAVDEPDERDAMLVATSADGGATWRTPIALAANSGRTFNDKNTVTADPTRPGVAYAVWSESSARGKRTLFTRTVDGGTTWEPARRIAADGARRLPVGHQIAVLPDGTLVMVYTRQTSRNGSTYMASRSLDAGATWSTPRGIARLSRLTGVVADPYRLPRTPRVTRLIRTGEGLVPDLGVDPRNGTLYVVWHSTRAPFRSDILLTASRDAGLTWSRPRVVSANRRTQAFTPSVEVAGDGTVAVTYYDLSADTPGSRALPVSVWVAGSVDGGRTFGRREPLVPRPFDLRTAPVVRIGRFLGDYQGLASMGSGFLAVFAVAALTPGDRSRIVAATIR
jgi:hypothetical protein